MILKILNVNYLYGIILQLGGVMHEKIIINF